MDFPSALEHDASDFYGPLDFTVGSTIEILQKRMVIYDCDDFTYDFYKHQFEVEMQRDMSIYALLSKPKPESTLVKPPPHTITSVGTPEDSLQNCLHLQPKAPKRDLRKLLSYAGKVNPDLISKNSILFKIDQLRYLNFYGVKSMKYLNFDAENKIEIVIIRQFGSWVEPPKRDHTIYSVFC